LGSVCPRFFPYVQEMRATEMLSIMYRLFGDNYLFGDVSMAVF
jgi:hypothetical protein